MVSVLMPVYKENIDWIKQAVFSILNQTYSDIEFVIVIDNPDRMDVVAFIESLNDDRIILTVNDQNIGLVKSLNKGIKLSSGEYIARMDADDISEKSRLQTELDYLISYNLDLVGCNVNRIDANGNSLGVSKCPADNLSIYKSIRHLGGFAHPGWLGKRSVFEELNGYREIDKAEDYDFLIRCVLNGYKLGCVQELLLKYRKNPKGISMTGKGRQMYVTRMLNKQFRMNKLLSVDEINDIMEKEFTAIELWENYYRFSAYWGSIVRRERSFSVIEMPPFDPHFICIAIDNFIAEKI